MSFCRRTTRFNLKESGKALKQHTVVVIGDDILWWGRLQGRCMCRRISCRRRWAWRRGTGRPRTGAPSQALRTGWSCSAAPTGAPRGPRRLHRTPAGRACLSTARCATIAALPGEAQLREGHPLSVTPRSACFPCLPGLAVGFGPQWASLLELGRCRSADEKSQVLNSS